MGRLKMMWTVGLVLLVSALAAVPASAAPDRSLSIDAGQRTDWQGAAAQGVTNYYYWNPGGAGNVGPLAHHVCNKEKTTYCEQILLELRNPLTPAEQAAGVNYKEEPVTVWLDSFDTAGGPVNDFDLLVYQSDATGTRGPLIKSDGDSFNSTKELVTFDVATDASSPSQFVLIDVVYYQVVNGGYKGHVTF
jgi:hypothetical protein